ncbi:MULTISPECIES: glycine betaine/L-proline ABC transporter permease ProW [Proteus]|jgi:glycine betaine/proline transport system permease protein|uniref:Glycine betaine transporter membrane protein n=2 Tax=Enterobacterales TaxID=91347 RepID=A0A379F6L1_PROVU|nr:MULTISPECIES: glycine betaine/L-proline ABC transporter permease ProW [Proteus]NBN61276.1 glycine betaine/L-proline ABC transporter permease ProW [Proteus sp. G2639]RNT27514.1 proline/glycine betaine ABC transporter permease ProW [Proteus mirabilis]AYY79828.1 proline/glycine betaine ABC transporter permease ProW [Proteus vulgaris]MBG5971789.1 glycine betaine/L-proline ABC transporter permease ProW [Proteus vulgaris]MBG5984435.1 glycine betaine/L-proline ABC transporter permease ProW [Proteu
MSNTNNQDTAWDTTSQETTTSDTTQETPHSVNDDPWATTNTSTTESDPWSSTDSSSADTDPWGTTGSGSENIDTSSTGTDWLDATPTDVTSDSFNLMDPFHNTLIPLDSWVTEAIDWIVLHFRPVFQGIRVPVDFVLSGFENFLTSMPAPVAIILFSLIAWQLSGKVMGITSFISLILIGAIGAWSEAMVTLALVLTSLLFCLIIGLPLGIWLASSDRASKIVRPLLDAMQTTPAFVYLVPIVMLFGIGNVPGVVVTIIFALPPIVRLTILGIKQVPEDLIEAAQSFGANPRQMLFKVQLPLAMPTIMAGVNQTLMLALSMVVIASMIAVGGLGQMVLRGIGRLDMGLAAVGGAGIVILAIILDRLTQSLGQNSRHKGNRCWYMTGPIGLICRLFGKKAS